MGMRPPRNQVLNFPRTDGYTRVATGWIAAIESPIGKIEVLFLKKRASQKR